MKPRYILFYSENVWFVYDKTGMSDKSFIFKAVGTTPFL